MAKVTLPHAVTLGVKTERYNLNAGEQEVSVEVEKALIEAGLIAAKKTVSKKPVTEQEI